MNQYVADIFKQLLNLGLAGDFDAVRKLPGVGRANAVARFSAHCPRPHSDEILQLAPEEREAFLKALAVYEDGSGLGSAAALGSFFRDIDDEDEPLIYWILANTTPDPWFHAGARSFRRIRAREDRREAAAEARATAESARRAEARLRIATAATSNLFNAVRRGDLKAVEALLLKGASPDVCTPDGVPLVKYAVDSGRQAIASALEQAGAK